MTASKYDIPAILALPVEENEYGAATIGQYLGASVGGYLRSGIITRQTYGNWKKTVLTALVKSGPITGVLQKDGSLYNIEEYTAQDLLKALEEHLTGADYSTLALPEPVREWYVVDTEEDDETRKMVIIDILSGPHTEEEARELKEKNWNGPSYKTTAFVAHIPTPEFLKPVA
jgi:hypothetical protein